MELREFDLDLPYVKDENRLQSIIAQHNCEYTDATKLDYAMNWKDKRRAFRLETRCITALYERLFRRMKTADCWKIVIECVPEVRDSSLHNYSGVQTIQINFDYDGFSSYPAFLKKQHTLEMLMRGIRQVARDNGWELERFDEVYKQVKQLNYQNEWIWKKPVKSPDFNYVAEVLCVHDVNSMDIYMLVKDKVGTEVSRELIISEQPDEFAYSRHLGTLKWLSTNQVALVSKNGDSQCAISIGAP